MILGDVRIKYGGGECGAGPVGRADLISAVQDAAWRAGGNAVIYVNTAWDDSTESLQRCDLRADPDPTFATGWIVMIEPLRPSPESSSRR